MLFILTWMFALILVFFISWAAYYFGGNFVVFDGVSKQDGMKLAGLEIFYAAIASIFSFMPLGGIVSALLTLALPFIMVKAIKKKFETGLPIAIMVYLVATVGKLLIFVPMYVLT
ncbi:MAG: hypothetical protein R6V35_03555 [Candidatus Nanohaloarchaea archaeon]